MNKWTDEEKEFIFLNAEKYKLNDLTRLFNERFSQNKTNNAVKKQVNLLGKKNMRFIKWNEEHQEWVKKNQFSYSSYDDFAEGFNKQFEEQITRHGIIGLLRKVCGNAKLNENKNIITNEQIEWAKERWGTKTARELVVEFNQRFGTNYKRGSFISLVNRRGIKMAKKIYIKFLKKATYDNSYPVGSEYVSKPNGYVFVKVNNIPGNKNKNNFPLNWKMKQQLVWEQNYGEIPKGKVVSFLDGDKQNCDIKNLILMTKKEMLHLQTLKWLGKNELTKAGLEVIRTEQVLVDKGAKKRQKYCLQRLQEHKKQKNVERNK